MQHMGHRLIGHAGAVIMAVLSVPASADVVLYLNGALDPEATATSPLWGDATVFDATSGFPIEVLGGATGRVDLTVSGQVARFIQVSLGTPEGVAGFAPGFYQGAIRAGGALGSTPHLPGMDVSANALGCNNVSGWFEVHESDFAADGSIRRLAVDFLDFCDGAAIPLFGAIRVDSSIPVPAGDAYAAAGRDQVADAGATIGLDGGYSRSISNAPLTYRWIQTAGPAVQMIGGTTASPTFVAPAVALGGRALAFRLEVTVPGGGRDTDTVSVFVHHPSDPQTRAAIYSAVDEPILAFIRTYNSPDPRGEDVEDFRYVFNAPDWPVVARMNGASRVFVAWEGAFPLRRGKEPGGSLSAEFTGLFQSVPLVVSRYPFIQGFDSNSTIVPYMSVEGHGAGCAPSVGTFEVLELEHSPPLDPDGDIAKLAIDFEQRCATGNVASVPLRGSVRVNSSIPLHDGLVPPPPDPLPVSVQFTISPLPVAVNREATFTWSSVNAQFCYGFNGFPLSGALSTSGSVRTSFGNELFQDIYVTCYSGGAIATDLERLTVVAATASGGSSGGGGGGSSGGGGGSPIDVIILALLAVAARCRARGHARHEAAAGEPRALSPRSRSGNADSRGGACGRPAVGSARESGRHQAGRNRGAGCRHRSGATSLARQFSTGLR